MNYEELVEALRRCAEPGTIIDECDTFDDCPYSLDGYCGDCMNNLVKDAAAAIDALQAQLPKRGEWIVRGANRVDCSVCGHSICFAFGLSEGSLTGYNYCPNCGAKMEVQE